MTKTARGQMLSRTAGVLIGVTAGLLPASFAFATTYARCGCDPSQLGTGQSIDSTIQETISKNSGFETSSPPLGTEVMACPDSMNTSQCVLVQWGAGGWEGV